MYAGVIVERAPAQALFACPRHPYTRALLGSIPRLERSGRRRRIEAIPGSPPDPRRYPEGCRFHPRCPRATPECRAAIPPLAELAPGHLARCIHPFS